MDEQSPEVYSESTARQPIVWQAHEYVHVEKTQDWFWALGLIAVAGAIGALLFNNVLFAIFILIAAFVLALYANRHPDLVTFTVSQRGVRINDTLYPFGNLKSFAIHELTPHHIPKLILEPRAALSAHIIIPLENVDADHVHDFLLDFLPEDEHEEPFAHHIMEWLGF
jgi:hypothetical protein